MPSPSAPSPDARRPVLVTRPEGRGERLVLLLEAEGLAAEHAPLTRLVPLRGEGLDAAFAQLTAGAFTHLVVTSRTAAECLGGVRVPPGTEVVAVGEGTAAALAAAGIPTSRVTGGSGADLVASTAPAAEGERVLFPASAAAARTVPDGLRALGYRVQEVEAYRPEPVDPALAVSVGLASGRYGAIVLTSPMIARRAADLGVHRSTAVITIGEPTSAAASAAGLTPVRQAAAPTDEALVAAVREALAAPSAADPAGASRPTHP